MRQRICFQASRFSSVYNQNARFSRTYATNSKPHPSDSIPIKGALPVSNRFIRNGVIFVGGVAIGAYYAYRSTRNSSGVAVDSAWSTFTLESKDAVSPTSAVFTLRSKSLAPSAYENLWQRAIWAVDLQQPQLQIVREYTPLPPALDDSGRPVSEGDKVKLHLLIREEFKGEVSGYLHRLPIGADVQVSKPYAQIDLGQEDPDNMVFVVGGTGITTALQAIHALLETKRDSGRKPFVHILWANRRREDCLGGISDTHASDVGSGLWSTFTHFLGGKSPKDGTQVSTTYLGKSPIVDELRRLKGTYQGRVKVDYFVDEEGTSIKAENIDSALAAGPDGKSFVAVSGPDGFMVNLAGEQRAQKNRVVERPASGILAGLKKDDWKLMVLG